MPTDAHHVPPRSQAARRVVRACVGLAILAWILTVARDQYGVRWLAPYDIALDVLFASAVIIGLLAQRAATRGLRHVGLRVGAVTVVIVFSLAAGEAAARLWFRNSRSSANPNDFIARHHTGPTVSINQLGFRDREVPPKSPDRYRIAVVGDSITWGQGIEERERFSNLIEGFLGPRYEVFNFGRLGANLPDHLEELAQALGTSPDFVLLQLFINDFETLQMERPRAFGLLPPRLDQALEASSLLYDVLNAHWAHLQTVIGVSESYVAYMTRNLIDPEGPNGRQTSAEVLTFFRQAQAAHVGVGAVIFPATDVMGRNGADYPFGFLHARVLEICTQAQVTCLDLLPTFSKVRDPHTLWVSPFDAHPNAIANRRAAQEIAVKFSRAWEQRE
jgi:hypothetical protein